MRSCLICHSEQKKTLFDSSVMVPEPYPLLGQQLLVQCQSCGFIYADSDNTEADYQDYYLTLNKHKKRAADASPLDQAYFAKIAALLDKVDRDAKILDFGSGDLLMQQFLLDKGFATVATFDVDSQQQTDSYDVIISTHTFEHILHADVVMQQLRELLNDDGVLLIAVPDVMGYDDDYYGAYNALDLEHINHFSVTSLKNLFSTNGFTISFNQRDRREVRPGLFYPETIVMGRKTAESDGAVLATDSAESAALIDHYLQHSATDFDEFGQRLAAIAERPKVVWGLGISVMRILQHYKLEQVRFVDSDARLWGRQLDGQPIISPDALAASYSEQDVFVVAAVNAGDIEKAIRARFGTDVEVITMGLTE